MTDLKAFKRDVCGLLFLAAVVFCACTQVPEYCGSGDSPFNFKTQQCDGFGNVVVTPTPNDTTPTTPTPNDSTPTTPTTPPQSGSNFSETAVSGQSFEMVFVTGGTFTMGCTSEQSGCDDDEKPTHSVTLNSYLIGKHEVTQGLWKAVMGGLPSSLTSSSSYGYGDRYPVYYVSWNDIVDDFIPKLKAMTGKNYRLPTEAEWEYAARGGKSGGFMYSGSNTIDDVAWYYGNSSSTTHVVGTTKSANGLGIYDMSGNVWEWVNDWYDSYSSDSQNNPKGPERGSYRVLRGGSWSIVAGYCRVSHRGGINPDYRGYGMGFRLAVSP
jgi:formylglycine-generating enzyme required for sulfatase activity